uniref:Putative Transmembrane protein n=1 Tax=Daphnia magna TaxID=35525 RepID=A0A0P5UZT7_9CRUS
MGPPSPFKSTTAVFSLDEENNYSSLNTISLNRSSFVSGPMCQCLLSMLTLAIMACFVFLFRDSIYHVLLWIEKQDTWVTCIMFTALFTIVSLPLTWGYILLNLACGYLFGMLAGILVVSTTAAVGVFFAHVIVKQLCLGFITTKLLNSHSLRAFVNVISGPQAFKVVAFARLTPIPFGLQNAIFAVWPSHLFFQIIHYLVMFYLLLIFFPLCIVESTFLGELNWCWPLYVGNSIGTIAYSSNQCLFGQYIKIDAGRPH